MLSIYDCFAGVQKHSNAGRETSVFSQTMIIKIIILG